ncbi:MAG: M13 family metallopeptidase [Bryobacterales bacterium]|nr:M13 family metallopeptidase [Bryobacterales bacterium]
MSIASRYRLAAVSFTALLALSARAQVLPLNFATSEDPTKPKVIHGFDRNAMDTAVKPCDNFFQYACGTWLKQNPIPADQSAWSRFNELFENNRLVLRNILEKAREAPPTASAEVRQVGDYYAACMNEDRANALGAQPLKPLMAEVAAVTEKSEFASLVGQMQRRGFGMLFNFGSGQDFQNASQQIAVLDQGGLGLPDRDYYLKDEERFQKIRAAYLEHLKKIFVLDGDSNAAAARHADAVMAIEKSLAEVSMDRVARRDTRNLDHRMPIAAAAKLMPEFNFTAYLEAAGAPAKGDVNVYVPAFFEGLNKQIASVSLEDWKTYFRWHILHGAADMLSDPFVNESFDFYGKTLQGRKELPERWKRCVAATDGSLGEALGKIYVEETYGKEGSARMAEMVKNLELALRQDIENLSWMTPATKKQALAKLDTMANKIGHPIKWRDYSSVKISRQDRLGNQMHADRFQWDRDIAKIGAPVDKNEWFMTPPTVNAYYDPQNNNINFPAGILQPPFFDKSVDDAVNYGAIGAVIGHELTHGFDDQGRRFDAQGNLKDWWTEADAKAFEERAKCFVDEYAGFRAVDDVHLNGELTLGENVADNGGLRIALMALKHTMSSAQLAKKIDGFTAPQRFFLGFAQVWCGEYTPEAARLRAQTDPHSPGLYRANGTVSNMPEFAEAFGCKAGDAMVRENACRVW